MADEENKNSEETVDEVVENQDGSDLAGEDSSSSQAAGEESSPAESDAADDSSADGASSQEDGEGGDSEAAEDLSPKAARKAKKAATNRKPRYTGTLEERRAQRDVRRKKKAVARRAQRAKQREEHKAAGPREGTPPAEKVPGRKKTQLGTVVSSSNNKTITIEIEVQEAHRIYKKVVRHTKKLTAHDEANDAGVGDTVRVIESRPLSKTKRWRLVEVVEKAR